MLAYLVIRVGAKWTDVYRLQPERRVTIGRAPTNQIVVKDERCSRNHAEIFHDRDHWTLRDLDSRNGTMVGGNSIRGDHVLSPGDVVRIAHCQLAFVHDLSKVFPESALKLRRGPTGEETVDAADLIPLSDSGLLDAFRPATITHRRDETRFLKPLSDDASIPKVGRAATKLCRLAFELAKQPDAAAVAKLALDGLFEGVSVDAGAILLVPRDMEEPPGAEHLQVVASRTDVKPSYHRVSNFLAATVLADGQAVLARNIEDDATLGSQDSKGVIHSTSVLCAPIRQDKRVVGLVHLYSTNSDRTPDPDDLEFTLAVADNVALALRNLGRQQELAENLSQSRSEIIELRQRLGAEHELIGSGPLMSRVRQEIARAAPNRATVLVRGESGVGKELVAWAIHFGSPRKKGPFVCLNCAALSETLLESELFGHEKGAFTGATKRKIGKFEAAHRGTLMLDEIGEMSPSIQAKFLRVLEGHPFERVGGSQSIKVDVRTIAATNRDLEKDVAEGKFRRDLYFRLHVLEVFVPPLRKRPEDIIALADHFLLRVTSETGRKVQGFTEKAIEQMRRCRWPGNVRELKNVVERAVILARSESIDVEDLSLSNLATAGESGDSPAPPKSGYQPASLAEIERRHVAATLAATGWNKSRSAGILGIERSTLDRKIRRYQLTPPLAKRRRPSP